jgi:glycosyltransferase involved in cell wall biosynthesis
VEKPIPQRPLVSICIPVYNGATWIAEALESALAQTYPELEIVVSDNASTDETAAIVRSYPDPRIRLKTAARNAGIAANHNRTVLLARGEFVKFLHHDDRLLPTCVEEMVALALEDPEIGLVFAPREVLLVDPDDEDSVAWVEHYGMLHEHFSQLQRINEGGDLLRQIIEAGVEENWIGEPSSVLLRRDAFAEVGMFNVAIEQSIDLDLWLRFLARFRVGFTDHVLSVYRHHAESLTARNARTARDWLDTLWMLETLCSLEGLGDARERANSLRRAALRQALRSQAKRILHLKLEPDLFVYLARRAGRRRFREPRWQEGL